MAHAEKLPWDLIEEILSRTPPKSLTRFRLVSRQWNDLFNDKTFISNHKQTFHFILKTETKIFSVSISSKIVVHELTLDSNSEIPRYLFENNGFLLCEMNKGAVVWNPWSNQTRWIESEVNKPLLHIRGIGYEKYYEKESGELKESSYKTFIIYRNESDPTKLIYRIHDFVSNTWKDLTLQSDGGSDGGTTHGGTTRTGTLLTPRGVSVNGTLYWVISYKSDPLLYLAFFDFLKERFFQSHGLPCGKNHDCDALVLQNFSGDRLSLLKQCHLSKKVEIWVTKNKVLKGYGENVEWMKFMEVSGPNFPHFVHPGSKSQPSYFIKNKKLVVCSCDETGRAWIYTAEDNKLVSKMIIDSVVDVWPLHCTYFPSLISVPDQGQIGDEKVQV